MRGAEGKILHATDFTERIGGKMHFSVAKGIKLQFWKDPGFECKVKEENIPKI